MISVFLPHPYRLYGGGAALVMYGIVDALFYYGVIGTAPVMCYDNRIS
jgi:hypothetical protein